MSNAAVCWHSKETPRPTELMFAADTQTFRIIKQFHYTQLHSLLLKTHYLNSFSETSTIFTKPYNFTSFIQFNMKMTTMTPHKVLFGSNYYII